MKKMISMTAGAACLMMVTGFAAHTVIPVTASEQTESVADSSQAEQKKDTTKEYWLTNHEFPDRDLDLGPSF